MSNLYIEWKLIDTGEELIIYIVRHSSDPNRENQEGARFLIVPFSPP